MLLLLAAMVGKTQGWRHTTVVLLNGDTFPCFYGAIKSWIATQFEV